MGTDWPDANYNSYRESKRQGACASDMYMAFGCLKTLGQDGTVSELVLVAAYPIDLRVFYKWNTSTITLGPKRKF